MKTFYIVHEKDGQVCVFGEWEDTPQNRKRLESWSALGYKESDSKYVMGYDGKYYKEDEVPEVPVEIQKKEIENKRQLRMTTEADPLRFDYEEALARGDENAEELKQIWLAKKDEIRRDLPYVEE